MSHEDIASGAEMSGRFIAELPAAETPISAEEEIEATLLVKQIIDGAERYYEREEVSDEELNELHDGLAMVIDLVRQHSQHLEILAKSSEEHPHADQVVIDRDHWGKCNDLLIKGESQTVLYRPTSLMNGDGHPHTTFTREVLGDKESTIRRANSKEIIDLMRQVSGEVQRRRTSVDF